MSALSGRLPVDSVSSGASSSLGIRNPKDSPCLDLQSEAMIIRACPQHSTLTGILWTPPSDHVYLSALYCKRNVNHCTLSVLASGHLTYKNGGGGWHGRYFHYTQLSETSCTNLTFGKYKFYKLENSTKRSTH